MDFKLKMLPVELGGTWVIDFDPAHIPIIEQAIIKSNREDLIICSRPVRIMDFQSLHYIGDVASYQSLSGFWEECERLNNDKGL